MRNEQEKTASLQSVERLCDVIEYLDEATKEASIQEISEYLQVNKSTIFRILNTLSIRGYVYQNSETKKYGLTMAFYHIGVRAKNKTSATQRISPFLPDLENFRNKYQQNINVATLDFNYTKRMKVVNLVNVKTRYMLERMERDLSSTEAYASACGKCMLAFAPPEYLVHFRGKKLEKVTPYTISDWGSLEAELTAIRMRGYSECINEHEVGISCFAVPVFAMDSGDIKAAISVSGETDRILLQKSEEMIADLHALATKLARVF